MPSLPVDPADAALGHLFTDQESDRETDLLYYGARYYDPWVGRFLSQDPALIGYALGPVFAAIPYDSQMLNAYSYVGNRPTIGVDPSGAIPLYPEWANGMVVNMDLSPASGTQLLQAGEGGHIGVTHKNDLDNIERQKDMATANAATGSTNSTVPETFTPRTRALVERTGSGASVHPTPENLREASLFFTATGGLSLPLVLVPGAQVPALLIGGMSSVGGLAVAVERGDPAGGLGSATGLVGTAVSLTPGGAAVGAGLSSGGTLLGILSEFVEPRGFSDDPRGRLNQLLREQGRLRTP